MSLTNAHVSTLVVATTLVAGIFAVDWWLPLGLTIVILYVVPVLIASRIPHPSLTRSVASVTSVLTILEIFRAPVVNVTWVAVCNRSFAVVVIWVTAILCLRRQRDETELRKLNEAIEQQVEERTADLAHANKQLDALRAEAESQLAAIVRSSGDAIIGKTLNGLIRSWNAGAERIYGYAPEEIIGRSLSVLCLPDRVSEVPAILDRVHRGEHVHNFETLSRRKDGKTIDVSLTSSPVMDGEGNIVALSTIARDITESKRIEAALRESEARFRMLADTAPVMVWMASPDMKCTFANTRRLEFTGRTIEQELGDTWVSGVHPQDLQRCLETGTVSFKSEQPFTMEYRLRRSDGEYRWVVDTGVPLFDHDRRLSGYIGTCIDLTEWKDMEDQLRKTVKEKESLLREVHHRVKNNLQVISSLLNLQAASIKDPQVAQLFRECQTRITSIALLHETLHRSNDLSCIRMSDYLRTLTGHVFRSYGVDPKAIALDLLVEDLEFDIDTGMTCGLIVEELVSNCLKHAFVERQGGRIQIDLQAQDDGAYRLRVSDDGVGIPKDGVLHNPDSLGLELVTLLAEKLEGSVELQSGQGTAWRIEFRQLHYQERM